MITIDVLFLNEDRHTHNIAVLKSPDESYHFCPFFDHGASLLSDTALDYPLGGETYKLMDTVKSKTFCDSFDEALDISEALYGNNFKLKYSYKLLEEIVMNDMVYSDEIKKRVMEILLEQKRKYGYLFSLV